MAKEAARRAWAKLAPGNGLVPVLLAALDRQTQSEAWTRDSGRFIPHASTWLNGQRWQDEVPEADAESDPATRLVCYSARDFDADGELKPEADARERARLAALRGAREPAR